MHKNNAQTAFKFKRENNESSTGNGIVLKASSKSTLVKVARHKGIG